MEGHDGEHDEYNREDIEHVENMLYANIHHNSASSSPNQANTSKPSDNSRSNNGKESELNQKNDSARRNTKRYWSNSNSPSASKKSNFSLFNKEKASSNHKAPAKTVVGDGAKDIRTELPTDAVDIPPQMTTPKQYTPYVPFLQFNDSTTNMADEQTQNAGTSEGGKMPNTTKQLVRKNLTSKKINPYSRKHMIEQIQNCFQSDQFKNMFSDETNKNADESTASQKRLNPFNPLSRKAKRKKKSNTNHQQNKSTSKNEQNVIVLEENVNVAPTDVIKNADMIDVDRADDDDDEDDDVIIIPTQAPPLICVDSSDDEMATTNAQEHAFTEPPAVPDNRRKVARCASPSSSIQSADDFIAQNDQRNFGLATFETLSDEDLCRVSEAVENTLHNDKQASNAKTNKRGTQKHTDTVVFTPPKHIQKEKAKNKKSTATNKSYEVTASSFTAVDVYESESSDMPDTIYAKGTTNKRKQVSDSDSSSSLESVPVAKPKRLRKRKCSGNAKESDVHSNESSSDLPDDDDDDSTENDDNDNEDTTIGQSYLVAGEALGKIKNLNKKKKEASKAKKSLEKRPQDDFLNKLTSIVHDQQNKSDDNDEEEENTRETSTESVAAQDIVETVLQRRTRKSKKNQTTDIDTNQTATDIDTNQTATDIDTNPTDNDDSNLWAVTDQVGETDELNIAQIFFENDNTASNKDAEKPPDVLATVQNDTNISEELLQLNRSNEPSPQNQPIQINEMNESNESNEPNTNEDLIRNANDDHIFDREIAWNDEMRRFYNDSWGGETFSLRSIRARMPKGFLNWMISNRDKSQFNIRRQIRCANCLHYGHPARLCPQPPSSKRCYMCGFEGHRQPNCPHKMCLLCGEKTQKFVQGCVKCTRDRDRFCYVCRQKGHRQNVCPDKWRRYHSTITMDQPLVQQPVMRPPKPRYCSWCAQKGHEAEKCNRANRIPVPLSVHVASYSPALCAPPNEVQNSAPKCTILATQISDYSFSYGNDVSYKGNAFYARFRRAVNLSSDPHNQSANEVMFVSETNLHDTSAPPIEVYDDDFGDNISSTDHFSSDLSVYDSSFMTFDNMDTGTPDDNNSIAAQLMDNQRSSHTGNAEIQELDNKMQTLSDLKQKLLSQTSTNANDQYTNQNEENCKIDEQQKPKQGQNDDISSTAALADFIPLTSNEPEKFEPMRSPSPVSADSTTAIIESTEMLHATIHLTPQHCKQLVTEKGTQFLRNRAEHFNVTARLEWHNYGNVLIVNGMPAGQKGFHAELREFFQSNEPAKPNYCSFSNSLPKNRSALIKFIRSQFILLDSPICNNKHMADPLGLYHRICFNQQNPSKANMRQASKLRKHLNMVLFGRFGFADGRSHLITLQNRLRDISRMDSVVNVPPRLRRKIVEHIDYIFSDMDHGNYENIIERYHNMKKNRSLPSLNLDRKLLGLKMNLFDYGDNNENTPKGRNFQRNAPSTFTGNSSNEYRHGNGDRMNALPFSNDIQINVSNPSTSNWNQDPSFQSLPRMPDNINRSKH